MAFGDIEKILMEFTFIFYPSNPKPVISYQSETKIARASTLLEMDQNTANEMRETDGREKSIKCNQCDSTFSQASHLRRYLRTHSGEKPNKCSQCDFASSLAGNLGRHLKIQSGEMIYMINFVTFIIIIINNMAIPSSNTFYLHQSGPYQYLKAKSWKRINEKVFKKPSPPLLRRLPSVMALIHQLKRLYWPHLGLRRKATVTL